MDRRRRFSKKQVSECCGSEKKLKNDEEDEALHLQRDFMFEFDDIDSHRNSNSNSSRLTQEWLEEARRMVASESPSNSNSSSRIASSPRFSVDGRGEPTRFASASAAAAVPLQGRLSLSSIDRRDPLSRSARRQSHRGAVVGLSQEILSKSAKHNPPDLSTVHKWFSNILKPSSPPPPTNHTLPPRHHKPRFQNPPEVLSPPRNPDPQLGLNEFLREQKMKILKGEANKIVLSAPSNSTSSMVAAICYAWLLENKDKASLKKREVVVPVMNLKREKMWNHRKASWLFHHVGLDATSLIFADEVDLEGLVVLVVGHDVLRTNGQDGSQCTVVTNKYCQEACDLLETPILRKLLLAGIVLDTKNLKASATVTRDAEAVQLLLVDLPPNYTNTLFHRLFEDERDSSFYEALRHNYGKPPSDSNGNETNLGLGHRKSTSGPQSHQEARISARKEPTIHNFNKVLPKSASASAASAGKNNSKSVLSKWLGLGSK